MGRLVKSQTLQLVAVSFWNSTPELLPYSVQTFEARKNSVRHNLRCHLLLDR